MSPTTTPAQLPPTLPSLATAYRALVVGATGAIGPALVLAHFARPAQDAARELLTVLDGLQPPDSGGFWAYDGQRLPW